MTGLRRNQLLRISLDTGPNHLRNISIRRFTARIENALPGRFAFQFYESGQLYGDRDATKALLWGDLDMAVPTVLQLARLDGIANLTSLPMFYGLPEHTLRAVLDDIVFPALARRLEARVPVRVLTPGLDLGYVQVFSTKRQICSSSDLAGMKIRVPGGNGNLRRLRLQGAYPVSIPWSDAPLSLSQGNIDAVATTYETAQSAALWDVGVRYVLEERAMFVQYVPLLRRAFWNELDPVSRAALTRCWREELAGSRAFAASRQAMARDVIVRHGVDIAVPDAAALSAERARLMAAQPQLAKLLQIPDDVLAQVAAALKAA